VFCLSEAFLLGRCGLGVHGVIPLLLRDHGLIAGATRVIITTPTNYGHYFDSDSYGPAFSQAHHRTPSYDYLVEKFQLDKRSGDYANHRVPIYEPKTSAFLGEITFCFQDKHQVSKIDPASVSKTLLEVMAETVPQQLRWQPRSVSSSALHEWATSYYPYFSQFYGLRLSSFSEHPPLQQVHNNALVLSADIRLIRVPSASLEAASSIRDSLAHFFGSSDLFIVTRVCLADLQSWCTRYGSFLQRLFGVSLLIIPDSTKEPLTHATFTLSVTTLAERPLPVRSPGRRSKRGRDTDSASDSTSPAAPPARFIREMLLHYFGSEAGETLKVVEATFTLDM